MKADQITERKLAEEALLASQQLIDGIINAIPVRVFWKDRNLVYLGCNRAFALDAGFSDPQDIIGKDDSQMLWHEQAESYRDDDRQVIEGDSPKLLIEETLITSGGNTLSILTSKLPLRDSKGEILGVLGTYLDITEHRQAEEALHTSELEYRLLIQHLHAGIVIHGPDTRILLANEQACVLLGLTIDQMMGKAAIDPAWCFCRDDGTPMPLDEYPVNRVLANREPVRDQVVGINSAGGGDCVWVLTNAFPSFTDSGNLRQVVVTFVDITAHKQAEAALRENEERLQLVMLGSQLGYWDWNLETNEVIRNARWAEMLGYDLNEIEFTVKQWIDFVHPDDRAAASQSIQDHLAGRTPMHRMEYRMRTKDGHYKWILDQAQMVRRNSAGQAVRMSGTHTDVSERRSAEAALAETKALLQAAMDQSSAGIAIADAPSGQLRYVNRAGKLIQGATEAEALTGVDAEHYVACWNLLHLDGTPMETNEVPLARAVLFGEECSKEFIIRRSANEDRTVLANAAPILNDAGQVTAGIVVFQDITERKRVEEKLITVMQAVESASDAVGISDIHGRHIYQNKALTELFGYATAGELQAAGGGSAVIKDPEIAKELYDQITSGKSWAGELEMVKKNGDVFPAYERADAIKDHTGNLIGLIGIITDITERKRSEADLRASEDRFRRAVVNSPFPILVHAEDGTIIQVSDSWCEITGYTREELTTIHEWTERAYGERKTLVQADIDALYAMEHRKDEGEYPIRTKSGGTRIWDFSSAPMGRLPDGRCLVISMAMDVTERKQAEADRIASEVRYRRLFESAKDGVLILDAETGTVVDVNPFLVEMLGYSLEDLIGMKIWELGFLKDLVANQASFAELQKTEYIRYENMTLETRAGRRIEVEFIITLFLVHDCKVIQCNIRDISERKRAEEMILQLNQNLELRVIERTAQLEAANNELEAFSYSVSHDLRAPLRAMDGFSAALLEDCAGALDAVAMDHLQRIRAGSQRMAVLIDDLLDLSRESRAEMRRERVNLTALARRIGEDLQLAHPDRPTELVVAPALTADADARMLGVVLTNLLENAWKFTGQRAGARIEVGALAPGVAGPSGPSPQGLPTSAATVFFVRDNGAGFDMAYADKLFGAFQRLHSRQEFEGTGIGLALVQRIIHRHRGRVWAEGEIGRGATFYFTLGNDGS